MDIINQISKQELQSMLSAALNSRQISPLSAMTIMTGEQGYRDLHKAFKREANVQLAIEYIKIINGPTSLAVLIYNLDIIKLRQITNPDYLCYLCDIKNDKKTRELVLDNLVSENETLVYLAKEIMGLNE